MEQALVFRAGTRAYAIPIEHVVETCRPLPVEPLSGMPPFVIGVAIVRGAPTPVIDVGELSSDKRLLAPARFVTLRLGQRRAALLVDEVIGVRALAAEAELPGVLQGAGEHAVAAVGRLDRELLLVLSATRIVPESVWQALP